MILLEKFCSLVFPEASSKLAHWSLAEPILDYDSVHSFYEMIILTSVKTIPNGTVGILDALIWLKRRLKEMAFAFSGFSGQMAAQIVLGCIGLPRGIVIKYYFRDLASSSAMINLEGFENLPLCASRSDGQTPAKSQRCYLISIPRGRKTKIKYRAKKPTIPYHCVYRTYGLV